MGRAETESENESCLPAGCFHFLRSIDVILMSEMFIFMTCGWGIRIILLLTKRTLRWLEGFKSTCRIVGFLPRIHTNGKDVQKHSHLRQKSNILECIFSWTNTLLIRNARCVKRTQLDRLNRTNWITVYLISKANEHARHLVLQLGLKRINLSIFRINHSEILWRNRLNSNISSRACERFELNINSFKETLIHLYSLSASPLCADALILSASNKSPVVLCLYFLTNAFTHR